MESPHSPRHDSPHGPNAMDALYGQSLSLLTDLYQLTMAYGYWKSGVGERRASFHLFFRNNPFKGGYAIAAGLHHVIDYLRGFSFDPGDLDYLASLTGNDGLPLFEQAFIDYLGALRFDCDVDAVPEGTAMFPHEPLVRVTGPLIQAQLIETPLLNIINFQTLIATKAARICQVAGDAPVLEFGLRRAQGVDGGLAASRAAYIGGCAGTSNVLAGKIYGIPVRGTHAHSWVMAHETEDEAFAVYADAMPNNCVFLVDTYDTIEGVKKAIVAGEDLRSRGHRMIGIRLDSGDLAWLSQQARALLDAAGFEDAVIIASNDLDEHVIESLNHQGAAIAVWGVGTKLVTAFDQPALGGVYKLSALADAQGDWQYKIKLSEQRIKISTPGLLNIRRFRLADDSSTGGQYIADVIFDELIGLPQPCVIIDPTDTTRRKALTPSTPSESLLTAIFRGGHPVYSPPDLKAIRARVRAQIASFHAGIRRLMNPHNYPVGLEAQLFQLRQELILEARGYSSGGSGGAGSRADGSGRGES